ncbi:hypothetical protein C0995_004107 [Termitomyces sp. Mi166|nr:hypothetical protein C0995_004107 [Termitomyces sp. Mi166\
MTSQALLMIHLSQITHSVVAMKLMAYTLAAWQSLFLSGGVAGDKPFEFAPSLSSTPTISHYSLTPISPTLPALHFPWVCHKSNEAQSKFVFVARCLVAHITPSRFLRALLYGIVIRECFPTMAAFITRWTAIPTWMANCAGAVTTLITLAPTLLRHCFSRRIWSFHLQWPVNSAQQTIPVSIPTPAVTCIPPVVEGQDSQAPEETSDQGSEGMITEHETPCDDTSSSRLQVSHGNDATETQTETGIQDVVANVNMSHHVEPQHEVLENLERNTASDHMLQDGNVVNWSTVVTSEPTDAIVEELLLVSESTFEQTITVTVEQPLSHEQEHPSAPELELQTPCAPVASASISQSLPEAVAPFIETLHGQDMAEAPGSPDNTGTTPPSHVHVESLLVIPSSNSAPVPLDQHTLVQIPQTHEVNELAELPFNELFDVPTVQLSLTDTDALDNSLNNQGDFLGDLSEPSTPIPICRTAETYPVTNTPFSLGEDSVSSTPAYSDSPAGYAPPFDLSMSSPVASMDNDPFSVVDTTTTLPSYPEDSFVPYDWDACNTSDDEVNVLPTDFSSITDDFAIPSTTFITPRASSPLMSIRELDPAYREEPEYMSFFWHNADPKDIALLGEGDDNLLDVSIDLGLGGVGREPPDDFADTYDDYPELEPSVSMLLDEIFPDTSWREDDDILDDTDLPGQPDVEDDWVLTDEMVAWMIEKKKQFDARFAAERVKRHEILDLSSSFSHSFGFSAISSTGKASTQKLVDELHKRPKYRARFGIVEVILLKQFRI